MKNCCYPLKRRIAPWEYVLFLGLFAGPVLSIYAVIYSGLETMTKGQVALFVAGIAWMFFGFKILPVVIGNMTALEWDDEWLRCGLRVRRWDELESVIVMNSATETSVTRSLSDFRRELVFYNIRGLEQMKILSQQLDSRGKDRVRQDDPLWIQFLHTAENRFSLATDSLTKKMAFYEERLGECKKLRLPTRPLLIVAMAIFMVSLIMTFANADTELIKFFLAAAFISVMIYYRYREYKQGQTPELACHAAANIFLLLLFSLDSHKLVFLGLFLASMLCGYLGEIIGWDNGVRYFMRKWKSHDSNCQ